MFPTAGFLPLNPLELNGSQIEELDQLNQKKLYELNVDETNQLILWWREGRKFGVELGLFLNSRIESMITLINDVSDIEALKRTNAEIRVYRLEN